MDEQVIYCCGCAIDVTARLTNGAEVYPNRPDLAHLPFWICDQCGNYVGCHHRTSKATQPLGVIPTPDLRNARRWIHLILDPLWKKKGMSRRKLYGLLSKKMGQEFHTAKLKTIEEARLAYLAVRQIEQDSRKRLND